MVIDTVFRDRNWLAQVLNIWLVHNYRKKKNVNWKEKKKKKKKEKKKTGTKKFSNVILFQVIFVFINSKFQ